YTAELETVASSDTAGNAGATAGLALGAREDTQADSLGGSEDAIPSLPEPLGAPESSTTLAVLADVDERPQSRSVSVKPSAPAPVPHDSRPSVSSASNAVQEAAS